MQIFDGRNFAQKIEQRLTVRVNELKKVGKFPLVKVVSFSDDPASRIYTQLKSEAARRVGIGFEVKEFSLQHKDVREKILQVLDKWAKDPSVTGIMIQKPSAKIWQQVMGQGRELFASWWVNLVTVIEPSKDVDGLHPSILKAISQDSWQRQGRVLPATAKAVISVLNQSPLPVSKLENEPDLKVVMIGRSDIVGLPVYFRLKNQGVNINLLGRKDLSKRLETQLKLKDFAVIITATGQPKLINGEMIADGVVAIDVGEPKPDLDIVSVTQKASFISPVPGGVGPVTVVTLLENAVQLCD